MKNLFILILCLGVVSAAVADLGSEAATTSEPATQNIISPFQGEWAWHNGKEICRDALTKREIEPSIAVSGKSEGCSKRTHYDGKYKAATAAAKKTLKTAGGSFFCQKMPDDLGDSPVFACFDANGIRRGTYRGFTAMSECYTACSDM